MWRLLLGLFVTTGLFTAGCSDDGDKADPLYSFPASYGRTFERCVDALSLLQSNMTAVLQDVDETMDPCWDTQSRLMFKIEEMPKGGVNDPPFASLVRFSWLDLEAMSEYLERLARDWNDCFSEIEQRLGCLDYVISQSSSRSDQYDSVITKSKDTSRRLTDLADYFRE